MEILSLKHINTFANFFGLSDSFVQKRVGWELLRLEGAICGIYGRAFALVSCRKGYFQNFSISAGSAGSGSTLQFLDGVGSPAIRQDNMQAAKLQLPTCSGYQLTSGAALNRKKNKWRDKSK